MRPCFKYSIVVCFLTLILISGCTQSKQDLLPQPEYYTEDNIHINRELSYPQGMSPYSFLYSLSFSQYQDYYKRFGGYLPMITHEEAIVSLLQLQNDPNYHITIVIDYIVNYCNKENIDIEQLMKDTLEKRLKGKK